MSQFNDSQTNAAAARDAGRAADVEKFNTQVATQVDQFNANQDLQESMELAEQSSSRQSNTQVEKKHKGAAFK